MILLGILLIIWGAVRGEEGEERLLAGLVIASLGGGELALREHLAGFRSHSSLLAGVTAFVAVTVVALGLGPVRIWVLVLVGVAVFGGAFYSCASSSSDAPAACRSDSVPDSMSERRLRISGSTT